MKFLEYAIDLKLINGRRKIQRIFQNILAKVSLPPSGDTKWRFQFNVCVGNVILIPSFWKSIFQFFLKNEFPMKNSTTSVPHCKVNGAYA